MVDDTTWTPPKSLTFSERMKLTYVVCLPPWKQAAASLRVVWSSGATASFNRTTQPNVRSVTVTGKKGTMTAAADVTHNRWDVTVTPP